MSVPTPGWAGDSILAAGMEASRGFTNLSFGSRGRLSGFELFLVVAPCFVGPTGANEPRVPSRARQPARGASLSKETLREGQRFGEGAESDFSSPDEENDDNYSKGLQAYRWGLAGCDILLNQRLGAAKICGYMEPTPFSFSRPSGSRGHIIKRGCIKCPIGMACDAQPDVNARGHVDVR